MFYLKSKISTTDMDNPGPYNEPPNNKKLKQTQAQVDEVKFLIYC